MQTNRRCSLLLSLVLLWITGVASAATTFNVDVQTHTEPRNAGSKGPPDVHWQAMLIFADTALAVRTTSGETVYDFSKRRRVLLDLADKTETSYSLFDTLGFRVLELQNRQRIIKGLASQSDTPQPTVVDLEHVLSISSGQAVKLTQSFDNGAVVYSNDGRELSRWTDVGVDATPSDMKNFVRFIRYSTGGHPQILEALQARHSVPNQLTFTFNQVFGVTTSHIVVSGRASADWPPDYLSGYSLADTGSSDTDTLLDRADRLTAKDADAAGQKVLAELKEDEDAHRPLAVFLDVTEADLITGARPSVPDTTTAELQADPALRQLTQALAAKSEADLNKAIQTLVELRPKAGRKAFMLELFEANDRVHLGDFTAMKQFDDVLEQNLAIASVYKDFGDLFILRYDMPRAWRCWDIGRRLSPQLPTLTPVTEFEKTLATQHPEYF